MKRTRKIMAMLLVLVMAFSCMSTAFAVETDDVPFDDIRVSGVDSTVDSVVNGNSKDFTLVLPAGTSLTGKSIIFDANFASGTISYNGASCTVSGGVGTMTATLTTSYSNLVVTVDDISTTYRLRAMVAGGTNSPLASSIVVGGTTYYENEPITVGAVTRYSYNLGLSSTTNVNINVNLDAALNSANVCTADAVLKNTDGTTANTGTKSGQTVNFTGVNLSSPKSLVVTNGTETRTYLISAYVPGETVTVYFAIRTYLVDEWVGESTTYYDYDSAGYGFDGDNHDEDVTAAEALRVYCDDMGVDNAPVSSATYNGNNRYIFDVASYYPLEVAADATVMDALEAYLEEFNLSAVGMENNYVSSMGDGTNMLEEFDCGMGSGWMYTVRSEYNDVASSLPNVGAGAYMVDESVYIDWYYTMAYGSDIGYSIWDL